jgi:hypothetical protein
MTCARTLALFLAAILPATLASAQEASSPQLAASPSHVSQTNLPDSPEQTASLVAARAPLMETPAALMVAPVVQPQLPAEHKFFDRQQVIALSVHGGVRLADTINTCRELAHGAVEDWIPTQSCAGIAVWQAGSVGLALGVGWLLHKHGHHRLERIVPWVGTGASAAGLTKSVFNIY